MWTDANCFSVFSKLVCNIFPNIFSASNWFHGIPIFLQETRNREKYDKLQKMSRKRNSMKTFFFAVKKKLSNYYSECFLLDFMNEGMRNWLWPKTQLWDCLKMKKARARVELLPGFKFTSKKLNPNLILPGPHPLLVFQSSVQNHCACFPTYFID